MLMGQTGKMYEDLFEKVLEQSTTMKRKKKKFIKNTAQNMGF